MRKNICIVLVSIMSLWMAGPAAAGAAAGGKTVTLLYSGDTLGNIQPIYE